MSFIENIQARQILDSRGNPTIEVDVITENGFWAVLLFLQGHLRVRMKLLNCAMVISPSILAKGVLKAVDNVNEKIAEELIGFRCLIKC